jgi:hypothetical protein
MKKLPLFFCLLLFACSSQKQVVTDAAVFSKYLAPYHVFSIGRWNDNYTIYTLIDSHNTYFTVKGNKNNSLKKGDVYTQ